MRTAQMTFTNTGEILQFGPTTIQIMEDGATKINAEGRWNEETEAKVLMRYAMVLCE